jgi:carbohydrate-selective porin OprB
MWAGLFTTTLPSHPQAIKEETLSGPDTHETGTGPHGHLFGDWGGERSRLEEKGVNFDLQYISDSLWNIKSEKKERLANWSRVRGTVDIDFGSLIHQEGLYFHATALWQGGGNLGQYLGLLSSPSGMSSGNTFRLDSWWLEKRLLNERIAVRAGQFAGQDFYGSQHYAASFIFEPMGYAFTNPASITPRAGNYLLYWKANQALWRVDPHEGKGLDATVSYDWSPADVNRNNRMLTAGLRFNEPLPLPIHNTMSLGYVRNSLSSNFVPAGMPAWKPEHGVEFNSLLTVTRKMLIQPVVQYYTNVGGGAQRAVVFGFRTKVEF